MSPETQMRFKVIGQIILISLIGTALAVGIYAFFIPESLLDDLFVVGGSFAALSGIIIYLIQFNPLMNRLRAAENEAQDLLKKQNEVLVSQAKSLRAAYTHSLKKLKESEERYALAVKGSNKGLWDVNLEDNDLYLSDYWKQILDYQPDEFPNSFEGWKLAIHPDDISYFDNNLKKCMDGEHLQFECEYRMKTKSGAYKWVVSQGSVIKDKYNNVIRIVGSQSDVSDKKQFEEQLYHDAFHDALTGLPNRALFLDRLNQSVLANQRREGNGYSVIFLDLDHFKSVNDTFGHAAGDALIIEIAQRIERSCRKSDTLARFGGDEFVLLMPDLVNEKDIKNFIKILREHLKDPVVFENGSFQPSCTLGVVNETHKYTSAEDVLRDADFALYKAKEKQRGTYQFFNDEIQKEAESQFRMETNLQKALARGEIHVFYQPLMQIQDGALFGFEALLRWHHPEYGYVSPDLFIPIAEETETIFTLSEHLIAQSLKQIKIWQEEYNLPDLSISINVSPRQIENERLFITLESSCLLYDLDPRSVIVDVTENAIFANRDKAQWYLKAMQKMGIRIALDDFGVGYSSLSNLEAYPFDIIKIDRSFLLDMSKKDHESVFTIDLINTIGHKMKKLVLIEGVENESLIQKIKDINCDLAQGHFFAAPQNVEDTQVWLDDFLRNQKLKQKEA